MAGSYSHIVDSDNNFIGVELLDDLGDAYEALEECHAIIKELSARIPGNEKEIVYDAIVSAWRKKHHHAHFNEYPQTWSAILV